MPRGIIIECDYSSGTSFSRVLDFNEALFRLAREDKWMSFPLEEIDKTTGQRVHVKSARRLRQALSKNDKLVQKHRLEGTIRLTVTDGQISN